MHFDALTLACLTHEMQEKLVPGRVQNVVLPTERSIGLEIYANRARHYLFASADPQRSRVYLAGQKLRRGTEATPPLLLLLRKYVRGSLLETIEQQDPTDRVLRLQFDHPEHGTTTLIVEPMGRLSNILLLDAGDKILGTLNRVPPGENAQRVLLPGRHYAKPPAQAKLSPLHKDRANYWPTLQSILAESGQLWRALVDGLAGTSPTLAREIAWRLTGKSNGHADDVGLSAQKLDDVLGELWSAVDTGEWQPGVVVENGVEGMGVVGFAAYPLHFRGEFVPSASMSQALELFDGVGTDHEEQRPDPYAGLRGTVAALIRDARKRVERQLAAVNADEPKPGEPEQVRIQAEWLLALASQIDPKQPVVDVSLGETTLYIQRDLAHTPVEQAERMFDRAAKMERAAEYIPERRAQLEADLAFLDQLQTDLALAQNQPQIAGVQAELRTGGFLRPLKGKAHRQPQQDVSKPVRLLSDEGFRILVGRNARQNDVVTFKEATADDLWLHIRDVPGAHVVVRCGGQTVSDDTIQAAAQLAAYFSSRRGETGVPVAVTRRRFVTRMPGGRPGQVHFRNEETVVVAATLPDNVNEGELLGH